MATETIALTGGFYVAKSLIAGAQRCVNLYPEQNQPGSPFPVTTYPTPGLTLKCTLPTLPVRGAYRSATGTLFVVGGNVLYSIDATWVAHAVGTIGTSSGPVSMSDNRLVLILVDGSTSGYYVDLTNSNAFGPITAAAFYGADRVDYLDTFFVFNQPNTANFYLSTSNISASTITGGSVTAGTVTGGYGYSNGVHLSVPLTGGQGSGATATITVQENSVTSVVINPGTQSAAYHIGDQLTASPVALGGGITGQSAVGGLGYTAGTYTAVPFTGGTGSLAAGTVVVSAGGAVTSVTLTNMGQDYVVGDVLTASSSVIGGTGTGFGVNVTAVNKAGSGFLFAVTAVNAGSLAFDALDIAAKTGSGDEIVSLISLHRELHLIGSLTSEVWYDAGNPDFALGELPGIFFEHGCAAKASVAKADLSCFWLGQDKQGQAIVFKDSQYNLQRISTSAVENAIQKYTVISDAIGFTYQLDGHVFYVLAFPTADKTWVYDLATELWHEWVWTDPNGLEHRHRANCQAFANGVNIVGDWQNGNIYTLDALNWTDNGVPIVRRRGFPHLTDQGRRVSYERFIAEVEVGTDPGTTELHVTYVLAAQADSDVMGIDSAGDVMGVDASGDVMGTDVLTEGISNLAVDAAGDTLLVYDSGAVLEPQISLRYSDTKGASWGNPIELGVGATGDFIRSVQARQLGMGRNRVFELFWSGNFSMAVNGAFVDAASAET